MRLRIRWGSIRNKIIVWAFVPAALILVGVALVSLYAYQSATGQLVIARDKDLTQLSARVLATELANYADPLSDQFMSVFDGGMVVFDANRKVLAVEPERIEGWGSDWDRRIPLRQFLNSTDSVFSDVMTDGVSEERVFVVVVPISGRAGVPVGWVAGVYRLSPATDNELYATIEQLRRGESTAIYLVDGNGYVIYHSDPSYIGTDLSTQVAVQQVMQGRSGAFRATDPSGRAIVASFSPVPGTTWGLVTEEGWASLIQSSQRYSRLLALLLGLGIVVPVVVVAFGLRRIMRPIDELTGAAQEMAAGNFRQRIDASTGDELEELAGQFNRMASELQSLYDDLEHRVATRTRELASLNTLAGVVSRSLDLDDVMGDALDEALAIMGMEKGQAFLLDEETECLHLMAHRGLSDDLVRQTATLPLVSSVAGLAAQEGRPVPRKVKDYPAGWLKELVQQEGLQLVVSTPLVVKERTVGAIDLGASQVRDIEPEELALLAAIGHQIGVAVENARLYEQAQQLAVIEERNRLARDLHDSVMQALYGVTLCAEAASRQLEAGQSTLACAHLKDIRDTTEEALREMRLLIFELRPSVLQRGGLAVALRARLESVEERVGITARFDLACHERLPADTEEGLYWVALEALNNALKHANADRVDVRLALENGLVLLEIADDGVGFDLERAREGGGFGLRGMEERVLRLGGKLSVLSCRGDGTRVRVEVER